MKHLLNFLKVGKTMDESSKSVGIWDETGRFHLFENGSDGIKEGGLGKMKKDFIVKG